MHVGVYFMCNYYSHNQLIMNQYLKMLLLDPCVSYAYNIMLHLLKFAILSIFLFIYSTVHLNAYEWNFFYFILFSFLTNLLIRKGEKFSCDLRCIIIHDQRVISYMYRKVTYKSGTNIFWYTLQCK